MANETTTYTPLRIIEMLKTASEIELAEKMKELAIAVMVVAEKKVQLAEMLGEKKELAEMLAETKKEFAEILDETKKELAKMMLNKIISFAITVFKNDRNYQNDMADGDYTTVILCLEHIIIGSNDEDPFPDGWNEPRLTMEQLQVIILSHGEAKVDKICLDNDDSDTGVIIDDLERMLTLNPHIDYDMTQVWSYNGTRRRLNESVLLLAIHLATELLDQE